MKAKTIRVGSLVLEEHDPGETLGNPKIVFEAFMECLAEGDSESALEILAGGLRHMNKAHLERRYRIPRRTAYNLLDKKSMPSLALVAKVCNAFRQEGMRGKSR